eukprot:gene19831-26519_t
MSNNSRSVAITLVRATSRMRVMMDRQRNTSEEGIRTSDFQDPLLEEGLPEFPYQQHKSVSRSSSTREKNRPPQNWFAKDMTWMIEIITSSYLNLLLFTVPAGIWAGYAGWSATTVFLLNFLALVPLSLILGDITEDLALRFGDVVGGLLNATFGNVIEIIISISALQRDLFTVVATSLVGSILSNLLLVLGCSFFFGGMCFHTQSYNAVSNRASVSLLTLATIGIFIPTLAGNLNLGWTYNAVSNRASVSLLTLATIGIFIPTLAGNIIPDSEAWILPLSRACAVVLLLTYGCFIYFHLYTHADHCEGGEASEGGSSDVNKEPIEQPMLTTFTALCILGIITLVVAVHSEFLTGALVEVSEKTGLGQAFLGMIVLPIAGNACEHLTAVVVAMKNKMDLSLGIAVGSSLQIALFAIPVVVLAGWATGHDFSLNFDFFSVIILLMSVMQTSVATSDANSHWLQGITLIAVYILLAVTYFFRD